jgi:hypothetical protein
MDLNITGSSVILSALIDPKSKLLSKFTMQKTSRPFEKCVRPCSQNLKISKTGLRLDRDQDLRTVQQAPSTFYQLKLLSETTLVQNCNVCNIQKLQGILQSLK